jgi:hypothetical protein
MPDPARAGRKSRGMRKIQMASAFIAAFAFSVLVVASALATLWLKDGKTPAAAVNAPMRGTLQIHKEGGTLGGNAVECTGLFEGTIGPGVKDSIALLTSLNGIERDLIKCTRREGFCYEPTLHAEKLPWATELLSTEGKTFDLVASDDNGAPGLESLCIIGKDLCEGDASLDVGENSASGALLQFLKKKTLMICNDGGIGWLTGYVEVLGAAVS